MQNKSIIKVVSSFLTVCMLLSSVSVAFGAAAAVTSDIKGHWAESQINTWLGKEYIKGYEDGSFKPNNTVTRAEFIAMINRSFGFIEEATISFTDAASSNWAYTEVAKAVKAGYIKGFEDGTIGANEPISRQEAAVIIDRLLNLSTEASKESSFTDARLIANWAKAAVIAAVDSKILKGYAVDNTFKPTNPITRAEAIVTLDRAIQSKVVAYDTAGTFGPAAGIETVNKDVVINTAGVTLKNMIITGKLTFASGIGSGDAFLDNVTVRGETSVQGGGENSIHFKNSIILTITVEKKNGTVRIVAEGSTTVAQVNVISPVTIQETTVTGTGFGNVKLLDLLPEGSKVILQGTFDNLEVVGNKISIEVTSGSIQNVSTTDAAKGTSLTLGDEAKIVKLTADAALNVLGKGTIESVTLSEAAKEGTTFETPNAIKAEQTAAPTATPTTSPTTSPTAAPINDGGSPETSDQLAPTITHQSITNSAANKAIIVNASAADNVGVASVHLFYRITGGTAYTEIAMVKGTGTSYSGQIPANEVTVSGIEYYIVAKDAANNARTSATASKPFSITIELPINVNANGINLQSLIKPDLEAAKILLPSLYGSTIAAALKVTIVNNEVADLVKNYAYIGIRGSSNERILTLNSLKLFENETKVARDSSSPKITMTTYMSIKDISLPWFTVNFYDAAKNPIGYYQAEFVMDFFPSKLADIAYLDKTSLSYAADVAKARQAYDNLTAAQKLLVSNYSDLQAAEAAPGNGTPGNGTPNELAVINLINNLNPQNNGFAYFVAAARQAYNKLTITEKALVSNYNVLLTAETELQAAQTVINLIANLVGTSNSYASDVSAARQAYDNLTSSQKALVTNYTSLVTAEDTIDNAPPVAPAAKNIVFIGNNLTVSDATYANSYLVPKGTINTVIALEAASAAGQNGVKGALVSGVAQLNTAGLRAGIYVVYSADAVNVSDPSHSIYIVPTGYIPIETAADLNYIRSNLNGKYIQLADIDLTSFVAPGGAGYNVGRGWKPIGINNDNFKGTYNGNGFTISKLKINRPTADDIGLFGNTSYATIDNVTLSNVDVIGKYSVGGLAGELNSLSKISNSRVAGKVTGESMTGGLVGAAEAMSSIKDSQAIVHVIGNGNETGGLVGRANNTASISNSSALGNVQGASGVGGLVGKMMSQSTLTSSYATGTVQGNGYVGGLVGSVEKSLVNKSYATGIVTGVNYQIGGLAGELWEGEVKESYATGAVFGYSQVGGLAGGTLRSKISNSYATGNVTGVRWNGSNSSGIGGLVGKLDIDTLSGGIQYHGTVISNSYAIGTVTGDSGLDGFAGYVQGTLTPGQITSSYFININTNNGTAVDKSLVDLKKAATFINWDFIVIWNINEDNGTPYLRWQQ